MIHSILITVHDNDFYSTFINLLHSIREAVIYSGGELYQDEVERLIKDGVLWHYLAFQNHYRFGNPKSTERYLLDNLKVWFNTEADKKVQGMPSYESNGEYYYLNIEGNVLTSL